MTTAVLGEGRLTRGHLSAINLLGAADQAAGILQQGIFENDARDLSRLVLASPAWAGCRVDPARNMRRFYRLDIAQDLFGGFLLLKQWGRIGAGGQIKAERYESADLAAAALRQQAERKRRRGYNVSMATIARREN